MNEVGEIKVDLVNKARDDTGDGGDNFCHSIFYIYLNSTFVQHPM